jgi:hypothetical protein
VAICACGTITTTVYFVEEGKINAAGGDSGGHFDTLALHRTLHSGDVRSGTHGTKGRQGY